MYIVTSEFTHLSNFIFAQQDFRCCADTRPGESNLPKIGENWKRRGRKVEMQGPLLGIIVTKKLEKIYIHINEIWLRCFVSRSPRVRIYSLEIGGRYRSIFWPEPVAGEFPFVIEYRATKISFLWIKFLQSKSSIESLLRNLESGSIMTMRMMIFDDEKEERMISPSVFRRGLDISKIPRYLLVTRVACTNFAIIDNSVVRELGGPRGP